MRSAVPTFLAICCTLFLLASCRSEPATSTLATNTPASHASTPVASPTTRELPAPSTQTSVGEEVDVWTVVEARPLQLPTLSPGTPCPKLEARRISNYYPPALGDGPVYAVPFSWKERVLRLWKDPSRHSEDREWYYAKVLWVASPDYKGPALVRGHQVDGPNEIRFDDDANPPTEMRFPLHTGVSSAATSEGWRDRPSYTRLRASGCYAYQVDGLDFADIIVFEAVLEEEP